MEEKMFDLMSKIYGELSQFRNETDKRFTSLYKEVGSIKTDVGTLKNDIIRLENKLDNNYKALFDGYIQTYEEVKNLSSKLDTQEVEIKVIKGSK